MTTNSPDYPWLRLERETDLAYEGFKMYLHMERRSLAKVQEATGAAWQTVSGWSSKNDWVERSRAFERHVAMAETDGFVSQAAAIRDSNIDLMAKLKGHLSHRLDDFIANNQDPSTRWSQALLAMAKVEQNSLLLKDDVQTTVRMDSIEKLVLRALEIKTRTSGE